MTINFDAFLSVLPMAGKGMIGIFIVTAVIIGATVLMNSLFSRKKDSSDDAS